MYSVSLSSVCICKRNTIGAAFLRSICWNVEIAPNKSQPTEHWQLNGEGEGGWEWSLAHKSTSFEWLRSMAIDDYTNMLYMLQQILSSAVCVNSRTPITIGIIPWTFFVQWFYWIEPNPKSDQISRSQRKWSSSRLFSSFCSSFKIIQLNFWHEWIKLSQFRTKFTFKRIEHMLSLCADWN